MSFAADQLWNLLPAHLRTRDAELANPNGPDALGRWRPGPLRELVELMAGQVAVLEESLEQLYDNHFVETAAPWALPYLGDLLGIRGLPTGASARSSRAEVGHTVAYRRRKGTTPMLELLARDVTGWPARAVEFFERLAATQHLNHLRPQCQSFASLRNAKTLEFIGTPFEPAMRTVEVRRIAPGRGRWNIPNVGLFLWRLQAYPHTDSPLVAVGELFGGDPLATRRFRLHPFGLDAPLFSHPATEDDFTHLAEPSNVPLPITRRRLAANASASPPPEPMLYGPGLSVSLERWVPEQLIPVPPIAAHYEAIAAADVLVCDLSDARDGVNNPVWNHETKPVGPQVALDPVLGRVVFGTVPTDATNHPPRATFHLGFSFDLGGGEYARAGSFAADAPTTAQVPHDPDPRVTVPSFDAITAALAGLGPTVSGAIEITDSGRYAETLPEITANGAAKELRAADGCAPVVLLKPDGSGQPWTIRGDVSGSVTLNGLWLVWTRDLTPPPPALSRPALRVTGDLGAFKLRHCTLGPERFWRSGPPGELAAAPPAHLEIAARQVQVTIENCVLPPLRVGGDGVKLTLRNCIIDAGAADRFALSNLAGDGPAGSWRLENCTVIGKVAVDTLELASNCIFLGDSVVVTRRQEGCVRFSWLPNNAASRTPRRYRCLPAVSGDLAAIVPQFTSLTFGHPAYAQLSQRCSAAIRTGGDDGAEMGAFHDLFQPQREAHLRARLAEYLRFGLAAGVFYES